MLLKPASFTATSNHRTCLSPGRKPRALGAHREAPEGGGAGWAAWGGSFAHGLVKILDLGLARMESAFDSRSASLTHKGAMMGTPDYVSPEQARDASSVDIRADLYSLGCTFFYLLTGRPPFPDGTMMERLLKHQFEVPPPIESLRGDVPPMVRAMIRKNSWPRMPPTASSSRLS